MRLSTMTNIHQIYLDDDYYFSTAECIRACAAAGFKIMDLSLSGITQPGRYLHEENSHFAWLEGVRAAMADTGVVFSQSHSVFYGSGYLPGSPEYDSYLQNIKSNIKLSGLLGIPWTVVHPLNGKNLEGKPHDEIIGANVDFCRSLLDDMHENHVGVSIENMIHEPFTSADSLLELLDAIDGGNDFGICWDTGHANLSKQDQPKSILKLGNRLKMTHIADNRGNFDDHLLPYSGTVDWAPLVDAMKNSGYGGDFNYEVHNASRNYPISLRSRFLKLAYDIGCCLLEGDSR
jgi:sugar phosphate isomerase/epimerase